MPPMEALHSATGRPTFAATACPSPTRGLDLSVLIPVYNEIDNIEPLHV